MTKFFDANVHSLTQEINNYVGVEPHNINIKYVITPHIGMSTIPNSNNVNAQNQNLPTHEFHSLLQKMNDECHLISDDVMFRKKQNPNEPLHLFLTKGVGTFKTFTLTLLIEGLLYFYSKHLQLYPSKKNIIHDIHLKSNI
jgi:hypothetical protein